ncbi:MAG TPA: 2-dehydropantoate 2-reductase [Candidatus Acidoferrales bacterium]|nr:2-dehydropantoate 2-reductase [Candidatus Acidoferrales bacterium]
MSTTSNETWPRVAVMGAGAVGCYFGGMLARAGAPVTLIGRRDRVEAIAHDGLFIDSIDFQESVAVAASTQPDAARDADLILFCVKTLDTEESARLLQPHLKPGATVVSLQNGVDNVERIRGATRTASGKNGIEALPAVVYVAAAMSAPGRVKHSGRGDLVVGHSTRRAEVERVAQTFERAGVPCRISENIEGDLWVKLILNCAGNALTALGRSSYGRAAQHELARQVMRATAEEAIAVARAAGIQLPTADFVAAGLDLAKNLGPATSSTAQDIERGKRTEIDALNGYITRRGAALGVPTPVNHTLYALVKLLEENS